MENILLGFDGSEGSISALEWVAARASHSPGRVTLTTVAELFESEQEAQRIASAGTQMLARLAPTMLVEQKILRGFMPGTFLESDRAADLVVVGAYHDAPVRALLTGWVPLRVSLRAIAPSCVVPAGWSDEGGPIVVGYTDDGSADAALRFAASEAALTKRRLIVVHTWLNRVFHSTQAEAHRAPLDDAIRTISGTYPDLAVDPVLINDDAAMVLASFASTAALVVIGSHRYGTLSGGFVGSVAWFLVDQMRSPLCVVPPESLEPLPRQTTTSIV